MGSQCLLRGLCYFAALGLDRALNANTKNRIPPITARTPPSPIIHIGILSAKLSSPWAAPAVFGSHRLSTLILSVPTGIWEQPTQQS